MAFMAEQAKNLPRKTLGSQNLSQEKMTNASNKFKGTRKLLFEITTDKRKKKLFLNERCLENF